MLGPHNQEIIVSIQSTQFVTYEWRVVVDGVGTIGIIYTQEKDESAARHLALYKYGEEGNRTGNPDRRREMKIFEDDDFVVLQG